MRTTFVLAISLFLSFSTTQAQDSFEPGYIVRVAGDTVHGFLKEQGSDETAERISFKASATDKKYKVFTPSDVKAFRYDGGYQFRAVSYSDTRKDQPVTRTCFAKLLVTGEYDLYSFTEDYVLFFLVRKDNNFYLLFDDDVHTIPGISGNFRNELNFFVGPCGAEKQEIEGLDYSTGSMIRFFQNLDACLNPDKIVATYIYREKAMLKFGFFAYVGGISFGNDAQYTMEARLRVVWQKLNPSLSLNLGYRVAAVMKRHFQDPDYLIAPVFNHETWQIKSIPLTIQYNFTNGVVQPFVEGGVSLCTESISTDNPALISGYNPYINGHALAFIFGAGIEVRLVHVLWARAEWRYEAMSQNPTAGLALMLP
ncbi:MAG TPA: hypothetical protein VNV35_09440 [Puia sp.]|jgi:hypothetical protein|nr:hypothetical protein [Puia sp.]